jgi:hypothetical protein
MRPKHKVYVYNKETIESKKLTAVAYELKNMKARCTH